MRKFVAGIVTAALLTASVSTAVAAQKWHRQQDTKDPHWVTFIKTPNGHVYTFHVVIKGTNTVQYVRRACPNSRPGTIKLGEKVWYEKYEWPYNDKRFARFTDCWGIVQKIKSPLYVWERATPQLSAEIHEALIKNGAE